MFVTPVDSIISGLNTTTTALSANDSFVGRGEINSYTQVGVQCKSDQTGTLFFDFSGDGTNWDSTFPVGGFKISANTAEFHTAIKLNRFFRIRFINDGTDQTYLRLFTYYGSNFIPSNAPLNQSLGLDSDALSTRPTIFSDEAVIGKRSGVRHFTKFCYRENLVAASGPQTVWATTGSNFVPLVNTTTFTVIYNSNAEGFGRNGARQLFFDYVDDQGLWKNANHVIGTSGVDVTSFSGLGINRVACSLTGSSQYNSTVIQINATNLGSLQAIVPASDGVTQQAIFHTDSNSYGVIKEMYIQATKPGGGNAKVLVKGYAFNRNIRTRFELFRSTIDTTAETAIVLAKPVGIRLSPTDVFYFTADTDTNAANIAIRFSLLEYKQN